MSVSFRKCDTVSRTYHEEFCEQKDLKTTHIGYIAQNYVMDFRVNASSELSGKSSTEACSEDIESFRVVNV